MTPIAIRVVYRNHTTDDAIVWPVDQIRFERAAGVPFMASFADPAVVRTEAVALVAWQVLDPGGPFDEWVKDVAALSVGTVSFGEPEPEG